MSQRSKNYEVICKIGQGSFGTVFKVRRKSDKVILVMKMIKVQSLSKKCQQESVSEVTILSSLSCPYIVKYYESFVENSILHIIMEYCEKGDLSQLIKKQMLPENKIWKYFIQTCMGLEYLHSKQILHRDVKALNIFLSNDDSIRIGDLGVAKILNNTACFAQTQVGSPYYLSPELCEEKPYNTKSDVWALGCVLYEMCTTKHPFTAPNQAALLLKIVKGCYMPLPPEFSPGIREIVDLLLEKDYKKRPSIQAVLMRTDIENKVSEYGIFVPISSVLSKKKIENPFDTFDGQMIDLKNKAFNSPSVQAAQLVEEAQKQLSENRKINGTPQYESKFSRPLSAQKPQTLRKNQYFSGGDSEKKVEDAPIKAKIISVSRAGNILGRNNSGREKHDYFSDAIPERRSEKDMQHGKKKSLGEFIDRITPREQPSYYGLRNFSPHKKESPSIKEDKIKLEIKKESLIDNLLKKNSDKPSFRINIKPNNVYFAADEPKIIKKVPFSAKTTNKLDQSYEDVQLVQNLPEIPKVKTKLAVSYLQESSPVRSFYPEKKTKIFKMVKKPLINPVFKQVSSAKQIFRSVTTVKNSQEKNLGHGLSEEYEDGHILRNKERESIKNEESLRKKCSELRSDIIKMIGGHVFNEMHNIFTSIITVTYKQKDEVTELDQLKIERFVNKNIRGESSKAIFSMYKLLNAETDLAKTEEMIRSIRSGLLHTGPSTHK